MTRRRALSAIAVGVAVSFVIDAAIFWAAPMFDRNLFGI